MKFEDVRVGDVFEPLLSPGVLANKVVTHVMPLDFCIISNFGSTNRISKRAFNGWFKKQYRLLSRNSRVIVTVEK